MIGIGGSIGALLRYGFIIAYPAPQYAFPLTIFTENMAGSFLLGFLLVITANWWKQKGLRMSFFGTGLLGSFTTFSTFSLNIVNLIDTGNISVAVGYLLLSTLGGLLAAFIGMMLAYKLGGRP